MFYDPECSVSQWCMYIVPVGSCLFSSQGPLHRFLAEGYSRYLTDPACLKFTRKILPAPFVLLINKNDTVFSLMDVGFTFMPEYHLWIKWCLVHPMPLAFMVLTSKSQEIWKLFFQKLSSEVLLSFCADGGQMCPQLCAIPFTLSPCLAVMKSEIAIGLEGSPALRTAIPCAPFQFWFLSDACQPWVVLPWPQTSDSSLTA